MAKLIHHDRAQSDEPHQGVRIIMDLFDVGPGVAFSAIAVSLILIGAATFYFLHSAPPTEITISSGPDGSMYYKNAIKYKGILEQNGVKVKVLTSEGSFQNLQRLLDPSAKVDVGFVQGGLVTPGVEKLNSLGSVAYQPLMLFYRGKPIELVSELAGKRVAVGPAESGTRRFALAILNANGIKEDGSTKLFDWEGGEAAKGLTDGKLDAAFVMSESSSSQILHALLHSQDVHLYNFKQAKGYVRKIDYLTVLELPQGTIDFGLNIPAHDVDLLGPMVELIVKKDFSPALIDLVLEAATLVHSHPGIYQKRGEFPAPIEHGIRVSDDAKRFHQSGKSWLYRIFPFWLASLIMRFTVVFLPMLLVLVPSLKSIPAFFKWKTQMKIRRHYRDLLDIERRFFQAPDRFAQEHLRQDFDRIEKAVNRMKVRPAFADQFYGLRGHIDYVRSLVTKVPA